MEWGVHTPGRPRGCGPDVAALVRARGGVVGDSADDSASASAGGGAGGGADGGPGRSVMISGPQTRPPPPTTTQAGFRHDITHPSGSTHQPPPSPRTPLHDRDPSPRAEVDVTCRPPGTYPMIGKRLLCAGRTTSVIHPAPHPTWAAGHPRWGLRRRGPKPRPPPAQQPGTPPHPRQPTRPTHPTPASAADTAWTWPAWRTCPATTPVTTPEDSTGATWT